MKMKGMHKNIQLSIQEIHPNLRFINLYSCKPGFYSGERMLYDHYFLYVHKGKGIILIGYNEYSAVTGDLFYCPPGVVNSIRADIDDPFLLTGINFDFTQNHRNNRLLYPIQKELFEPDYVTEHVQFTDFEGFPDKINLARDTSIRELIYNMLKQYKEQKRFWELSTAGMLQTFIANVMQHVIQKSGGGQEGCRGDEIIKFLTQNYMRNITNQDIARCFHYHPDHINRIVYSYTGMTLKQYIIDLRIRAAIDLLLHTDLDISEIASEVGYENVYYFSRIFKKKTGYAPSCFRQYIKLL